MAYNMRQAILEARNPMKVEMDKDGRITIPAKYRHESGIKPGDAVELIVTNGEVGLIATRDDSGMAQDAGRDIPLENASYLSKILVGYKEEFQRRESEDSRVATIRLEEDNTVVIPSLYREKMNISRGDRLNMALENGEVRIGPPNPGSGYQESDPAEKTRNHPREIRVGRAGEIKLPDAARDLLGVTPGDTILAKIEDETLRIYTFLWATNRIRKYAKNHPPDSGTLLSEELIQERRAESQRERYG